MDRENLLKRLTMLDFMAVDMQLFLDTHPDDTNAIAKYNFQWVDNPWPWENKFNFSLD